jgi:hypothetical protein
MGRCRRTSAVRSLGAFGVALRDHVRTESRFRLKARAGISRSSMRASQRCLRSANRFGTKPPALTAQAEILAGVVDERSILRWHVAEGLETGIDRLQRPN